MLTTTKKMDSPKTSTTKNSVRVRLSPRNAVRLNEYQSLSRKLCPDYCLSINSQTNLILGPALDKALADLKKVKKPYKHRQEKPLPYPDIDDD